MTAAIFTTSTTKSHKIYQGEGSQRNTEANIVANGARGVKQRQNSMGEVRKLCWELQWIREKHIGKNAVENSIKRFVERGWGKNCDSSFTGKRRK